MKKEKTIVCLVLILAFVLSLCACSAAPEPDKADTLVLPEPSASAETVPGYISTELEMPGWIDSLAGSEIIGDTIYLAVNPKEGGIAAASYDTMSGQWQRYDLETGDAYKPNVDGFSATGDSLWVLLRESLSAEEAKNNDFTRERDYYLLHMDLRTGAQSCTRVDFWQEGQPYLISLLALDAGRALVGDNEKVYLLDPEAGVLDMPDVPILGGGFHVRVDGTLYLETRNGFAPLDTAALRLGTPVEGVEGPFVYGSNLGRFLITEENRLYCVDTASGEKTELFDWMDVALRYKNSYGLLHGLTGFENSSGVIYHLSDGLTKISKGQVPAKKTLTLGCWGDATDEASTLSLTSYTCADSLMDAILRFNNSDPEYRIEVKPLIYHDETERDRLLVQLATGSGIDVLDTSLLPEGAVDKELLVDLLPYIDADERIGREDFIPSLLGAMTKDGGLYEYVDKYTMLTMITHPAFCEEGTWTAERIESLMAQYPEMRLPSDPEDLMSYFCWAATAEFMDWTEGTCDFDSSDFIAWLSLLKTLSAAPAEPASNAFLFYIVYDFAQRVGYGSRNLMKDEYLPVGFPNADGTGSYFMKLGAPNSVSSSGKLTDKLSTVGSVTSLGIMSSSENRDGAWRFVRTFMLGEEEPLLSMGIPVLKDCFERAIETELCREYDENSYYDFEPFQESDAQYLRELVYNTAGLVHTDGQLLSVIRSEVSAYLDGQKSAEEAARQVQSRLSIYMAEHSG